MDSNMPIRDFDVSRTTLIDHFACGDCKFDSIYARTANDDPYGPCPKCNSNCFYLKRLSARIDDDPVKPSVRIATTSVLSDLYRDCSVEELVSLMSEAELEEMDQYIDGEEWKFDDIPSFMKEDYDFFSEDGHDERTAPT